MGCFDYCNFDVCAMTRSSIFQCGRVRTNLFDFEIVAAVSELIAFQMLSAHCIIFGQHLLRLYVCALLVVIGLVVHHYMMVFHGRVLLSIF